jgi:hypothetical protein
MKIIGCQQVKGFPCDSNNTPPVVLDSHDGRLYGVESCVLKAVGTDFLGLKESDVKPVERFTNLWIGV